jgi:hypothetical protein
MFLKTHLTHNDFSDLIDRYKPSNKRLSNLLKVINNLETPVTCRVNDIGTILKAGMGALKMGSTIEQEQSLRLLFNEYYTDGDGDPYEPVASNDSKHVSDILKKIVLIDDQNPETDTAYKFFNHLIQDNILFPMSFLVFRMYITFQAGSSIFMKKGSETGVLTVKDTAVMLDRITTDFKLSVQARFTAGTVIHNTENITIVPHTFATAYKGGAGTRMFNPGSDVNDFQEGNCSIADLFVVAVPYDFECAEYWTDITGEMNKLMYVNDASDHNRKQSDDSLMYPTAQVYKDHWGWVHPMDHHALEFRNEEIYDVRDETLAIQSYQRNFNANSGMFDIEIEGKGAMGARVRPKDFRILQGGGDEYGGRGIEGSTMRPRD